MNTFLLKYKSIWIGALITFLGVLLLALIGFIRIPDDAPIETTLIFTFWWIVISFVVYQFDRAKNKRKLLGQASILLALFVSTFLLDATMNLPDNPLTFTLVVAFWLYLFYLLSTRFFNQYRLLIIATYALAILYFTYVRFYLSHNQDYREYLFPVLLFPIPIFIGLWIYEQWKQFQVLKAEKSKAELALLKSQINPHFFFNTLNNLYSLTINQSDKAPEVIVKLSDMMRYTIYEGKKEFVTLDDEIAYLKNYIELHELRHRQKVDIDFQTEIEKGVLISPLLFIVLLENAFKHGVETMTEGAFVHVKLISKNKNIYFSVQNSFDPEEASDKSGIGLDNLEQRLNLIYPGRHELISNIQDNIYTAELTLKDI